MVVTSCTNSFDVLVKWNPTTDTFVGNKQAFGLPREAQENANANLHSTCSWKDILANLS